MLALLRRLPTPKLADCTSTSERAQAIRAGDIMDAAGLGDG